MIKNTVHLMKTLITTKKMNEKARLFRRNLHFSHVRIHSYAFNSKFLKLNITSFACGETDIGDFRVFL